MADSDIFRDAIFFHDAAFDALQRQLRELADRLRAGLDVAPAQRLRLEGSAAALIAGGADIALLEHACAAVGGDVIDIVRDVVRDDGEALRFECRQRRAPVYPSGAD